METIADRYRRLRTAFADRIRQVPPHGWANPSPCEEWTALDLVGHVIDTQGMFEQLVGRTLEPGPAVADDALGAFTAATVQVQTHLDDPVTAAAEFDGAFGRSTFEDAVDGFLCFDLVVHGWDLARAAGLDERLEPDDIARVREATAGFGDALRSPGVCGAEISPNEDASEQDKLLAFLGRRP
jgi:uncharacterized protein (TIGR03086 family)